MKKKFYSLLMIAIVLIASSCQKESLNPEIPNPEPIDHAKDFLKDLRISRSDRSSPNYIRGEFDGKLILFSAIDKAYYYDDIGWNGIFIHNSNGLDQINLIRQTSNDSVEFAIYINQSKIFTRQFPYRFNEGGYAQFELINLNKLNPSVPISPNDATIFTGHTDRSFKLQVTSFVDNILEGTFEGSLKSLSGSTIIVKNGKFHIKVKVDNS